MKTIPSDKRRYPPLVFTMKEIKNMSKDQILIRMMIFKNQVELLGSTFISDKQRVPAILIAKSIGIVFQLLNNHILMEKQVRNGMKTQINNSSSTAGASSWKKNRNFHQSFQLPALPRDLLVDAWPLHPTVALRTSWLTPAINLTKQEASRCQMIKAITRGLFHLCNKMNQLIWNQKWYAPMKLKPIKPFRLIHLSQELTPSPNQRAKTLSETPIKKTLWFNQSTMPNQLHLCKLFENTKTS